MSKNIQSVIFRWRSASSGVSWLSVKKELGSVRCSRTTENHHIWNRIDGNGFTIYLSDVRLADSSKDVPVWEAVLESLSLLPPSGVEKWESIVCTINSYLEDADVEYEKI